MVCILTALVFGTLAFGVLLVAGPRGPSAAPRPTGFFGAGYVGSETCATCHRPIYDTFRTTGHPAKLRTAAEARAAGLPKPDYVSWDDVLFVIGGFRWKARYVGQDGFILTGSPDGKISGRNQFNLETAQWVNYEPGRRLPYDCGECHTTGYVPIGNQLRRPGLIGTWALNGVQCEACHGRGQVHASNPSKANIRLERSASLCGQCHRRGTDMSVIPAAGGWVQHREQYQEFLASPHNRAGLSCVTCHDPHRRARQVKATGTCENCHTGNAAAFRGSKHQLARLACTSCHMPNTGPNAVARSRWEADDPSHLFKINTDPDASLFTPDGRAVGSPANTLEFVCLRCHSDRTKAWAAANVRGIHSLGK
ncbi:MAG: multiheme c-type cytochrome [Armatimonadota bacterium]|nr:multiheme c-type cytochrome [Armatimonadota bacterium]